MRRRMYEALGVGAVLALMGCDGNGAGPYTGSDPGPPPDDGYDDPPPAATIHMQDDYFEPALDTVEVGTAVRWRNQGSYAHNSTSDTGVWGSPDVSPGGTYSFTFNAAGEFSYHCTIHGSPGVGMTGTLVVIQ